MTVYVNGLEGEAWRRRINTLLPGATAVDRRLIEISGAAPSPADPTLVTQGWDLQGHRYLHLYLSPDDGGGAASDFTLLPWFWSSINGEWHPGTDIPNITEASIHQIEIIDEERVYLQMTATADAANNILRGWGGANSR